MLAVEQLSIARSALERGESPWPAASTLGAAAAIEGGDGRRRAKQPSQEERLGTLASPLTVHGQILRSSSCSSARSAT